MTRSTRLLALAPVALLLAACGGKDSTTSTGESAAPSAQVTAGGEQTPDAGGSVIEVKLLTDDQGNNRFDPADVAASPGDVVRFTLVSGVHNVHFLPDSNPGVAGLPAASDMLQLPGQTYDLKVTQAPGRYYFQCDPHALLGMLGHLTVSAR
jgi:plastocyanin